MKILVVGGAGNGQHSPNPVGALTMGRLLNLVQETSFSEGQEE